MLPIRTALQNAMPVEITGSLRKRKRRGGKIKSISGYVVDVRGACVASVSQRNAVRFAQWQNKSTFAKVNHCQSIYGGSRRLVPIFFFFDFSISGFERINKYSHYTLYWLWHLRINVFLSVALDAETDGFECINSLPILYSYNENESNGIDVTNGFCRRRRLLSKAIHNNENTLCCQMLWMQAKHNLRPRKEFN